MIISQIEEISQTKEVIQAFMGYNHALQINDGEWFDTKNMCNDYYPVLANRKKRDILTPEGDRLYITGMCRGDNDDLYVASAGNIYRIRNSKAQLLYESVLVDDGEPKQIIKTGNYYVVFPDGFYWKNSGFNNPMEQYINLEATSRPIDTRQTVRFMMCSGDGDIIDANRSDREPEDPENMQYWIDTSQKPAVLKRYSTNSSMWVPVATTKIRIEAAGLYGFKSGDGVKITGITVPELADLEGKTFVLNGDGFSDGAYWYTMPGFIDGVYEQNEPITFSRKMPDMDYVIECGNRLWGCKFGQDDIEEDVKNEIYASKLGDFKNWNCFEGIATDSYAVTIGNAGEFTGAISFDGNPLFFKEDCIIKIYGNMPSNYQVQVLKCKGVQKGSGASVVNVNGLIYYKSPNGVCVYDGTYPQEASQVFGDLHYKDAVGATFGNKYYVSMQCIEERAWHLFCFDTALSFWQKIDNIRFGMACDGLTDIVYIGAPEDNGTIGSFGITDGNEGDFDWFVESGKIGTDTDESKYISALQIRLSMDIGAHLHIYLEYDSEGEWIHQGTIRSTSLKKFTLPVRPRRCDHFRFRLSGKGGVRIFSLTKTIEGGSDSDISKY